MPHNSYLDGRKLCVILIHKTSVSGHMQAQLWSGWCIRTWTIVQTAKHHFKSGNDRNIRDKNVLQHKVSKRSVWEEKQKQKQPQISERG